MSPVPPPTAPQKFQEQDLVQDGFTINMYLINEGKLNTHHTSIFSLASAKPERPLLISSDLPRSCKGSNSPSCLMH